MSHNGLDWEQVLWAAGHRVTPQRSLILDAVCTADGHTSLGEIYARVRRTDDTIDRSTVYRALHLFVELGIVLAADTGDGETYYEIRKPQPHHHLVCRQCGSEQEIGGPAVQTMFDEIARRHGFQVTTEHLVLFGLCATCRQAEPRPMDR
jgi:Fur family ferric uptake transcriptional regulator